LEVLVENIDEISILVRFEMKIAQKMALIPLWSVFSVPRTIYQMVGENTNILKSAN
jgi:hypothetical protein